jgi:3-polyprenyl-4-hydroxybenzoate decarboxylase
LTPDEREKAIGCKVIIDATFPAEWPTEWIPRVCDFLDYDERVREKVVSRWKEYGF